MTMAYVVRYAPNPSRWPWIAGALVAAAAAGGAVWWWRSRRQYVGSGWSWPHRSLFPTEESFGEALARLGYGSAVGLPEWEILSEQTMSTVRAFQSDFNAVRTAMALKSLAPELSVDGLIGESTIDALRFALDYNADYPWLAIAHASARFNMGMPPLPE